MPGQEALAFKGQQGDSMTIATTNQSHLKVCPERRTIYFTFLPADAGKPNGKPRPLQPVTGLAARTRRSRMVRHSGWSGGITMIMTSRWSASHS